MNACDFEGFGVNLIELVACVVTCQWCDGWADEAHGQWGVVIYVRGVAETRAVHAAFVVVVEYLQLVFMCMTEENASDGVRRESCNDRVKKGGGIRKSITAIVTGQDVTNDPSPLVFLLAGFQFFDEVFQNPRLVWVGEVEVVEDVVNVPLE